MRHAPLLVLLLLIAPSVSALEWSEILFDPQGSDNGREFIEIAGIENLTGCTVRDSASADTLVSLHEGSSGLSLIVEDEGIYSNLSGPSLYGAGKAIGNGLGNTFEQLTLSCNGTVVLQTSYNASLIPGYKEGLSIVFVDGAWAAGVADGTPGAAQSPAPPPSAPGPAPQGAGNSSAPPDAAGPSSHACNATLAITLSEQRGFPGDVVSFTIVSGGYASFAVDADGEAILEGDTLSRREYALTLPNASRVRIVAQARECDARGRATRIVEVMQPNATAQPAQDAPAKAIGANATAAVRKVPIAAPPGESASPDAMAALGPDARESAEEAATESREVIVDADSGVVPWVSAFGIVTLLVSAGLFLRLRKDKDEKGA